MLLYLSELLDLEFNRRWRCFYRFAIRSNSSRLHLLLQLINLILDSPNPPPLPTQIPGPQCIHKQTTHNKWVYQCKAPPLQNPQFPIYSQCILQCNNIPKNSSNIQNPNKKQNMSIYLDVYKEGQCDCCKWKSNRFQIIKSSVEE